MTQSRHELIGTYRVCSICELEKPIREFALRSGPLSRPTGRCLECDRARHRNYKSSMPESRRLLHGVWATIIQRCCNPNHKKFPVYGARGISVCDEWRNSFEVFYQWCVSNGWKRGLQIDREDNDGNYCPENCRFVTAKINRRNSPTMKLSVDEVRSIKNLLRQGRSFNSLAKEFGVTSGCISHIKAGRNWSDVTEAVR